MRCAQRTHLHTHAKPRASTKYIHQRLPPRPTLARPAVAIPRGSLGGWLGGPQILNRPFTTPLPSNTPDLSSASALPSLPPQPANITQMQSSLKALFPNKPHGAARSRATFSSWAHGQDVHPANPSAGSVRMACVQTGARARRASLASPAPHPTPGSSDWLQLFCPRGASRPEMSRRLICVMLEGERKEAARRGAFPAGGSLRR